MKSSTHNLILASDAPIDLQVHTIYSDGTWTPDALLDYLVSEGFGLVAITDHDRVDTVETLQRLALEKGIPVLIAVEMTTSWRGEITDVLCYGFNTEKQALADLANDVLRRQRENTQTIIESLHRKGVLTQAQPDEIAAVVESPSAQQPHELINLMTKYGTNFNTAWNLIVEAGFTFMTTPISQVVDAAHQCGAVCLIAHPGRKDGFVSFDTDLLDQLRAEAPIDGIEAYYPKHTPEQVEMYLEYARKHGLLISSGSDSHGADKKPIKYAAELSRSLLEHLGIQLK